MRGEELNSASVNDDSSSAATKRPRIVDSVSPTQEQRNSSLNILPGHTCGHCGKACTAKGKISEATQEKLPSHTVSDKTRNCTV